MERRRNGLLNQQPILFNKLIIIFIVFVSPLLSFAQEGFSHSSEWADSTYAYLIENGANHVNLDIAEYHELSNFFHEKNEHCKANAVSLFESEYLNDVGLFEKSLLKNKEFESGFTSNCDSKLLIASLLYKANTYYINNQYDQAEQLCYQALDIYDP